MPVKLFIESLIPWGTAAILWLQRWQSPWLDGLFVGATVAGSEVVIACLLAIMYWSLDRSLGLRLSFLAMVGSFSTATLKEAFAIPRPSVPGAFDMLRPTSFAFPSGHAQAAITTFGYLAIRAQHVWVRWLCVALIPLIALSRVYLGAHYPQDVVAGLFVGLCCLWAFICLQELVTKWARKAALIQLAMGATLLAAVLTSVGVVATASLKSSEFAWAYAGLIWGFSVGWRLERHYVRFSTFGTLRQRIARVPAGLILVAMGDAVIKFVEHVTGVHVLWLHTTLGGLVFTFGAPWCFVWLHLSARARVPSA